MSWKMWFKTQDAARKYIEISEKITYNDEENNVEISIYPHNDYRITSMVDYNSEILGVSIIPKSDIKF